MPLPKRKFSKSRRDKRRTHWKISATQIGKCSHCGKMKPSHQACPFCGYYRDRQVVVLKEKKKKEE